MKPHLGRPSLSIFIVSSGYFATESPICHRLTCFFSGTSLARVARFIPFFTAQIRPSCHWSRFRADFISCGIFTKFIFHILKINILYPKLWTMISFKLNVLKRMSFRMLHMCDPSLPIVAGLLGSSSEV